MSEIDYSRYTIDELLQARRTIDADLYPENHLALLAELDRRRDEVEDLSRLSRAAIRKQELSKLMKAENRVRVVGVFQMIAAVVLFLIAGYLMVQGALYQPLLIGIMVAIIALNAIAGYTAYKRKLGWLWLTFVNQFLQLPTFLTSSLMFNYSGVGGIYFYINWQDGLTFGFNALLNPGFSVWLVDNPGGGYIGIDLLALVFLIAVVTVWNRGKDTA